MQIKFTPPYFCFKWLIYSVLYCVFLCASVESLSLLSYIPYDFVGCSIGKGSIINN